MGKRNGLRALQVCVSRHDGIILFLGFQDQTFQEVQKV